MKLKGFNNADDKIIYQPLQAFNMRNWIIEYKKFKSVKSTILILNQRNSYIMKNTSLNNNCKFLFQKITSNDKTNNVSHSQDACL